MDLTNRILVAVDVSNLEYSCVWCALKEWKQRYFDDYSVLRPPEETDQSNLPDLLNYQSFRRTLYRIVQEKLERLKWIVSNNHQMDVDLCDGIDFFFCEDGNLDKNFRKIKYPEYKLQRRLTKKQFNVGRVKRYIQEVAFKELGVEDKMGYRILFDDECECDDLIAILMRKNKDYMLRVIISSDHDFLQIPNVYQYDVYGNRVERKIYGIHEEEMKPGEYLLWKIVNGDESDNIKHVFDRYGEKKSFKLIRQREVLKRMLNENKTSAERFILNRQLIDFSHIPQEMIDRVELQIEAKMKEIEETERSRTFMDEDFIEI